MMLENPKNGRRVLAFLAFMAVSLVGLLFLPPIHQDQNYHDFADQRTILGIPHFWNVVSNLPFIVVGVAGIRHAHRDPAIFVLFLGILVTGFGSSYYHLDPNDYTLFWDRLPISISFMAILALAIEERLDAKAGAVLLWPLIADWRIQPLAVALDRRSAALWLGAVLSLHRVASALFSISAQIQRHILLAHCCGTLWLRKARRILRRCDLFNRLDLERAYIEAHCCSRRVLRNSEIFPKAATDPGVLISVSAGPSISVG